MIRVPPSVMPKGVEHAIVVVAMIGIVWVPPSVMPKGVEHLAAPNWNATAHGVPPSVMPKGVEHVLHGGYVDVQLSCATLSDAERR